MNKLLLTLALLLCACISYAQNVGIGTLTPQARLHVTDSSVLFSASSPLPAVAGNPPISGVGNRMMWYADKAAFRVGASNGINWDKNNIGNFSFATGFDNKASGLASTSMGEGTIASGSYSTSMGAYTTASGLLSTTMGDVTIAKAYGSLSIGSFNDDSDNPGTSLNAIDRIFQIGNGNFINRKNAMTVLRNGNTGIGTATPDFPLSFTTSYGEKISLWGNPTIGRVGFGVQPSNFQMLTDAGTDITFGYGLTASAVENMRIKYNGSVGIGTATPLARFHVEDSSVLFTALPANEANPQNPPISGAGSRMMWYANKSAFRVGGVDGVNWDKDNTGVYSFASGYNTKASAYSSTSMGNSTTASADYSTALGAQTTASGNSALSMGAQTTASGNNSTAMGSNTIASGNYSTAIGTYTAASGYNSTAMGYQTTASEFFSTAMGYQTTASGFNSTAMGTQTNAKAGNSTSMGKSTTAKGLNSTSMGLNTKAVSDNSLVLGKYNDTTATNSLFEIGNGTADNSRANAVTVIDNGNVGIGATTPSTHGHGGNNKIVEIKNANVSANSQSQIVLTTGAADGSMGGVTWAQYNVGIEQRAGFLGCVLDPFNTGSKLVFYTRNNPAFLLSEKMTIDGNGNVGIGITNPAYKLHLGNNNNGMRIEGPALAASGGAAISVGGNGDIVVDKPGTIGGRFIVKENGNVGIGTAAPTERLQVVGNILASGTITPSDFRYKENIVDIANPLQKVVQLRGVTYNLRTTEFPEMQFDPKEQIGLIAQEVEKVLPTLVHTGGNGYKGVEYEKIVPLLIEGMKEQQKQIELQQKQIYELKGLVQKMLNK
jgi:Chaperone of endosialidase/Head domain of trimeric autotransporter adhesin